MFCQNFGLSFLLPFCFSIYKHINLTLHQTIVTLFGHDLAPITSIHSHSYKSGPLESVLCHIPGITLHHYSLDLERSLSLILTKLYTGIFMYKYWDCREYDQTRKRESCESYILSFQKICKLLFIRSETKLK